MRTSEISTSPASKRKWPLTPTRCASIVYFDDSTYTFDTPRPRLDDNAKSGTKPSEDLILRQGQMNTGKKMGRGITTASTSPAPVSPSQTAESETPSPESTPPLTPTPSPWPYPSPYPLPYPEQSSQSLNASPSSISTPSPEKWFSKQYSSSPVVISPVSCAAYRRDSLQAQVINKPLSPLPARILFHRSQETTAAQQNCARIAIKPVSKPRLPRSWLDTIVKRRSQNTDEVLKERKFECKGYVVDEGRSQSSETTLAEGSSSVVRTRRTSQRRQISNSPNLRSESKSASTVGDNAQGTANKKTSLGLSHSEVSNNCNDTHNHGGDTDFRDSTHLDLSSPGVPPTNESRANSAPSPYCGQSAPQTLKYQSRTLAKVGKEEPQRNQQHSAPSRPPRPSQGLFDDGVELNWRAADIYAGKVVSYQTQSFTEVKRRTPLDRPEESEQEQEDLISRIDVQGWNKIVPLHQIDNVAINLHCDPANLLCETLQPSSLREDEDNGPETVNQTSNGTAVWPTTGPRKVRRRKSVMIRPSVQVNHKGERPSTPSTTVADPAVAYIPWWEAKTPGLLGRGKPLPLSSTLTSASNDNDKDNGNNKRRPKPRSGPCDANRTNRSFQQNITGTIDKQGKTVMNQRQNNNTHTNLSRFSSSSSLSSSRISPVAKNPSSSAPTPQPPSQPPPAAVVVKMETIAMLLRRDSTGTASHDGDDNNGREMDLEGVDGIGMACAGEEDAEERGSAFATGDCGSPCSQIDCGPENVSENGNEGDGGYTEIVDLYLDLRS